jgi:hypothetical protein
VKGLVLSVVSSSERLFGGFLRYFSPGGFPQIHAARDAARGFQEDCESAVKTGQLGRLLPTAP